MHGSAQLFSASQQRPNMLAYFRLRAIYIQRIELRIERRQFYRNLNFRQRLTICQIHLRHGFPLLRGLSKLRHQIQILIEICLRFRFSNHRLPEQIHRKRHRLLTNLLNAF